MIDKDQKLKMGGKVLTSTGIPLGKGPTAIFVPVGESIDDHITLILSKLLTVKVIE